MKDEKNEVLVYAGSMVESGAKKKAILLGIELDGKERWIIPFGRLLQNSIFSDPWPPRLFVVFQYKQKEFANTCYKADP